jgi:hypothetical protein
MGELAKAQLMHDLARFSIAIIVAFLRLQRSQRVEGCTNKAWINNRRLQRDDQTCRGRTRLRTRAPQQPAQIGEIAADFYLEIKTRPTHSVIHEVQVLVNAATDRAAER